MHVRKMPPRCDCGAGVVGPQKDPHFVVIWVGLTANLGPRAPQGTSNSTLTSRMTEILAADAHSAREVG